MASVNKVILIGNVGRDPEIRYTQSGEPIANFTLATNEVWNDKSGQKQERTEWHRVEVFGKTAQVVRDYVTKGRPVYIEGSVRYEEWTDKDGNKRNTTRIRVSGPGLTPRAARRPWRGRRAGPRTGRRRPRASPRPRAARASRPRTTTSRSEPRRSLAASRARAGDMATLLSLERYLPPYRYDQEVVTRWVREWLGEEPVRAPPRGSFPSTLPPASRRARASFRSRRSSTPPTSRPRIASTARSPAGRAPTSPAAPSSLPASPPAESTWW